MLTGLLLAASLHVTADARSQQPGELVVLTITAPPTIDSVRVRAFDRDVATFAVGPHEWRALVGIDLEARPGSYRVSVEGDPARARTIYDLVVAPRVFRTRRLTVDPAFVTPPTSARDRIEREAALLNAT